MRTRPADLAASWTGLPSTAITSFAPPRSPSLASAPLTVTRPASIQDSISRREPRPAAATTFWIRSAFGAGGLFRFRVGWADARFCGGYRLELQRLRDFLERRQLLQRGQSQVVEELPRRRIERRPTGRFALA